MLWFKCNEIIPGAAIGIGVIAIALAGFFATHEYSGQIDFEEVCRMAEGTGDKMQSFREAGRTAVILGYTGETGSLLAKALAKEKLFSKVTLIGRRKVQLNETEFGPEFEQRTIDFENMGSHVSDFKGHDVCFCCLGTTRGKAGEEGFKRVDHDYVLKSAEMLKAGGTKHYQFMSTFGADHKSSALYIGTKGQVEEALKVMHFDRLTIFRPAVLMVDRKESRPVEAIGRFFLKPISWVFPTAISVPIEYVVKAMINNAITPSDKHFELYENKEIHVMGSNGHHCSDQSDAVKSTQAKEDGGHFKLNVDRFGDHKVI